ncbi:MAG: hypothetical protein HYY17_04515 [Planctomycetes bacterium]|nr:hypothetical protein [Planctomycetota bacterium]
MDKLKQNPFLAAMIGAGVVLLALAGILLYPALDEKGNFQKKVKSVQLSLRAASTDTPGRPDIESWNNPASAPSKDRKDYAGKLTWSYRNIALFYAQYDWNLEWWKTNGEPRDPEKLKADEIEKFRAAPSRGEIEGKIRDWATGPEGLQATLKKKNVAVGMKREEEIADPGQHNYGFNWESDIRWNEIKEEEVLPVLKTLQKRYWIRERIANACLDKSISVQRIVDVYFFRPLHPKLVGKWGERPQTGTENEILYVSHVIPKRLDRSKFEEYDLPGELGKTITFGVTVDLMYAEVPKFVRKLMDLDLNPRILVSVIGTRVVVLDQNRAEETYDYNDYEGDPTKTEAERKAKEEEKLKEFKPKPVRLFLTCQVVDFDAAKVPDWAKPLLPDWAKPAPAK